MDVEPQAVIFDMDGVLCAYDLAVRLEMHARHAGSTAEDVHRAIWTSGFEDEADAGAYASGALYLAAFAERLGAPVPREVWIAARKAAMTPRLRMLSLVAALTAGRTVAMLTNNGPLTEDAFPALFPDAARLFGDRAFFSWRFLTKKPDPAIYTALAARLGLPPERCLFIDDKARNVKGARAAGMRALHFTAEDAFLREAAAMGLVT
jgi:putative hydrolase of the HAD superfamily